MRWFPRRAEQATIAALVGCALAGMLAWWLAQGGAGGRLIDIDDAPPLVASFRVDVNRADWPELSQLPGVGEVLARRIVEYRTAHGPFRSVGDLRRVSGIGPVTFRRLEEFLLPVETAASEAVAPR